MGKSKPRRTPSVYSEDDGEGEVESGSDNEDNQQDNDKKSSAEDSSDEGKWPLVGCLCIFIFS